MNRRGREITPRRRALIVGMHEDKTFPDIAKKLGIKANTCAKIARHAKRNLSKESAHVPVTIQRENLDPCPRPGRPTVLSEEDKDQLVTVTKRDSKTRRMPLAELQVEAGLSSVSKQTVLNALHDRGLKAYKENIKPALKPHHCAQRLKFATEKIDWLPDKEWADWAFTDEMGITTGGTHGLVRVWRGKEDNEKWDKNYVGQNQIQGATVMCWGMIMYGYKGPFHVWEAESEQERLEALAEISQINAIAKEEVDRMEAEWKASEEYVILKQKELADARQLRQEAKVILAFLNCF